MDDRADPRFERAALAVAEGLLRAYRDQHREVAEGLLAQELTFTSPNDDHIDRSAYFEKCFPTADRFRSQTLLHSAELDSDHAVIVYEYELHSGERFRNTEMITVREGRATEIQVFFGGRAN